MLKKKVLICTRVSAIKSPLKFGDIKAACSECGELVSISPSSWSIIHDNPSIDIKCTECALAQANAARRVQIHGLTPAQADELADIFWGED